MNNKRFLNQNILITGSSRGIGRAIALAFAKEGASVCINYHSRDNDADDTLFLIHKNGGKGMAFKADLAKPIEIENMVEQVTKQVGNINILINNAGMLIHAPFLNTTLDQFDQCWHVNVRGHYYLTQLVTKEMIKRNSGSIVFISSILARMAITQRTAYCSTKGALESLTKALAIELAPNNIRVNAIAPGLIRTEMLLSDIKDPDLINSIISHIPNKRLGEPDEIAQSVLFLCSPQAAYLNGTILHVDGALGAREPGPVSE